MRKISIGGEERPILFTTWTIDKFYRLTGINLYDRVNIAQVFKKQEDDVSQTPDDYKVIAKFAFCALASAVMPDDADETWEPPFTWMSIYNKLPLRDDVDVYMNLFGAYLNSSDEEIIAMIERGKNLQAPQLEGQEA